MSLFSNLLSQTSRHAMTMAKCTRLETSGRRNTWVPSAPARAMEGSRCGRLKKTYVQLLYGLRSLTSQPVPLRAGAVRTAGGPVCRLTWRPTWSSLRIQTPSTGTEKMLCVNWSVSDPTTDAITTQDTQYVIVKAAGKCYVRSSCEKL